MKVNIRNLLEDYAAYGTMNADVRIAVEDLMQCLDPSGKEAIDGRHEFDIDIHERLAENRQIAHIWGTDDVQDVRPDLDEDQAWQVLRDVEKRLDSQYGISWGTIEIIADELFGPAPETGDAEEA